MDWPLAMLIVCGALLTACSEEPVLSPSQFTSECAHVLRQTSSELAVEVKGDLQLRITRGEWESIAFLDNAYTTYKLDPSERASVIQRFVAAIVELPMKNEDTLDRAHVVPVIKDRGWLEDVKSSLLQLGATEVPEHVYDDLNTELVIVYAVDSSASIRFLSPEDVEALKLERDELLALACQNLKRLLPKIERRGDDGLFMITAGGDYEASLLLFDSVWEQVEVRGDIVVALPTRDLLFVTGSEHKAHIETVADMAKKAHEEGPYSLTPKLFVYREGHFAVFER